MSEGTGLVYETEFVVDMRGDAPELAVKLILNQDDVIEFRRACYDASYYAASLYNAMDASLYAAMGDFMGRVEKQLGRPALTNIEDWKATK